MTKFSEILKLINSHYGDVQAEVARKLKLKPQTISDYKSGRIKNISIRLADTLEKVYGVSKGYIYDESKEAFLKPVTIRFRQAVNYMITSSNFDDHYQLAEFFQIKPAIFDMYYFGRGIDLPEWMLNMFKIQFSISGDYILQGKGTLIETQKSFVNEFPNYVELILHFERLIGSDELVKILKKLTNEDVGQIVNILNEFLKSKNSPDNNSNS